MSDQSEKVPSHSYAIFYEAFRSGSVRKMTVMFKAEELISTSEQLQGVVDAVARSAVSNGQANSKDDVSITGISLLNNDVAASKQDASKVIASCYTDSEVASAIAEMSDYLSLFSNAGGVVDASAADELLIKHKDVIEKMASHSHSIHETD